VTVVSNEIAPAAAPVAVEPMTEAIRVAVAQLETDLARARSLIADLRPATLDELGVEAAIEDLAERARSHGLAMRLGIDLAYEQGRAPGRRTSELDTTIYRIVQEALTNTQKHSGARTPSVNVEEDQAAVRITVRNDGSKTRARTARHARARRAVRRNAPHPVRTGARHNRQSKTVGPAPGLRATAARRGVTRRRVDVNSRSTRA
jgi:signal transduction histidine kinase